MPIRVAIVDDHRLVREGLTKVLGVEAGIEIVGACGLGAEVPSLLTELRPDVLLLDIALPDHDGLSLIETARERSPDTRVLMLSMHSEPEYAAAAVDRGACGLVGKDASPDVLVEAIRAVAAGSTLPVAGALTAREREVLAAITAGLPNSEIAEKLSIRAKTVEGHCERLMAKLDIHTRAGLVAHGRRLGL
jgi:two-component system nitrate/nitrite response regulator NarL